MMNNKLKAKKAFKKKMRGKWSDYLFCRYFGTRVSIREVSEPREASESKEIPQNFNGFVFRRRRYDTI